MHCSFQLYTTRYFRHRQGHVNNAFLLDPDQVSVRRLSFQRYIPKRLRSLQSQPSPAEPVSSSAQPGPAHRQHFSPIPPSARISSSASSCLASSVLRSLYTKQDWGTSRYRPFQSPRVTTRALRKVMGKMPKEEGSRTRSPMYNGAYLRRSHRGRPLHLLQTQSASHR